MPTIKTLCANMQISGKRTKKKNTQISYLSPTKIQYVTLKVYNLIRKIFNYLVVFSKTTFTVAIAWQLRRTINKAEAGVNYKRDSIV